MSVTQTDPVMVVGRDAAVLHSLQLVLRLRGFLVTVHPHLPGHRPSGTWPAKGCLLIEHNMPMTPGVELLKTLRARGVKLPAILFTSMMTAEMIRQAIIAGALKVHGEPLVYDDLVADIESALRTHANATTAS